jgi:hypothetical protein
MSEAAQKVGPRLGGTYVDKTRERWASGGPEWIKVLARAMDSYAADGKPMRDLAQLLGCNPSVLSAVIGRTYKGRYDTVEQLVRGKLMSQTVDCPAAGTKIARDVCAGFQTRKKASSANPLTAKFPAACKACPNAIGGNNA